MTAEKKKQLQTLFALAVLLAVAGTYAYFSLRRPAAPVLSPAEKVARAAALPSAGNARIRLDLIEEKPDKNVVGRRNVFQYYVPPPPPKPAAVPVQTASSAPPRVQTPQGPPPPPPPPPSALSTFKYDGVGIVAKPGKLVASISDGLNRYAVTEGEFIQGRYRINRVTENSVEIEDLDQNRRQTYNRSTQ